jgi:hypothetical protein
MATGLLLHEQRRLARRELIYYLRISDRRSGRELGRLGDVHAEGLLILSEKPLPVGAVFRVALELPKAGQTPGRQALHLKLEIVWNRPKPKNSGYHESGARFQDIDDAQREAIDGLIDLFAMPGR